MDLVTSRDWRAKPRGWHWLRRQGDKAVRLAFFDGFNWRVADAIGRTREQGSFHMANTFDYVVQVEEPK